MDSQMILCPKQYMAWHFKDTFTKQERKEVNLRDFAQKGGNQC